MTFDQNFVVYLEAILFVLTVFSRIEALIFSKSAFSRRRRVLWYRNKTVFVGGVDNCSLENFCSALSIAVRRGTLFAFVP